MVADNRYLSRRRKGYGYQTLRPINCLIFIALPLAFFQWGAANYGTDLVTPQHLHSLLRFFGATAAYLPALMIVFVLLAQQAAHKDGWSVQPKAIAGMLGESIFWTGPLIVLSLVTGHVTANAAASIAESPQGQQALQHALRAIGAGIYEEFVFRLIFISLAMLIFVDILGLRKDVIAVGAVIVAAVIFSLGHFTPEELTGQVHFERGRFLFLATAGVYWGALFVFRGFGIAVGCHILWDVFVLISQPTPG